MPRRNAGSVLPEEPEAALPWWSLRDQRAGAGVILAVVLVVAVSIWYAIDTRNNKPPAFVASTTSTARGPVAVSPAELETLAATLGHPVYWVGPRPETTYELTVSASGQAYVRYLPKGVPVGSAQSYLTIGTYPVTNAFAITSAAIGSGDVTIKAPPNGIAGYPSGGGTDVHLAFPGSDVQIEVYDPSPAVPPQLVTSGAVVPV